MNSNEIESNLTLRVKSTNNTDLTNAILFRNTGSYYNIALTRRYSAGMNPNTSNCCIQTGAGGNVSALPVRLCV